MSPGSPASNLQLPLMCQLPHVRGGSLLLGVHQIRKYSNPRVLTKWARLELISPCCPSRDMRLHFFYPPQPSFPVSHPSISNRGMTGCLSKILTILGDVYWDSISINLRVK